MWCPCVGWGCYGLIWVGIGWYELVRIGLCSRCRMMIVLQDLNVGLIRGREKIRVNKYT